MTIDLRNDTLHVELEKSTGALIGIHHHGSEWRIMGRRGLGQSFRLLLPMPERRNNPVWGTSQEHPTVSRGPDRVEFSWQTLRSEHGGIHDISLVLTYVLEAEELVVSVEIDNRSELVVENVFAPYLGDVRPRNEIDELRSISYDYGGALNRSLWPVFENTPGYYGVDVPTQLAEGHAAYGTPASPFTLVQGADYGLHIGVRTASSELVVWHAELWPGWADSLESRASTMGEIGGRPVDLRLAAVHVPYLEPGERRALTPVALAPYSGDWHAGADVYIRWRDTWLTAQAPPKWLVSPHSWQQIQINSPEDELRTRFGELVAVGQECADLGVKAIQLVGWNEGGQDRNNPSHVAEPRLGGPDELRRAIEAIQALGVKVILFAKFTWADRATPRFRDELVHDAVKDPYGDYYHYPGYRYETVTQLLDINTRRLIPMCFSSEHYLDVCRQEFARVLDLGADGILFDESLHHSPALLCFDTSHGHRAGAPVYANDRELIRKLRLDADQDDYLFAGEACYDWQFDTYQLSYHRSEDRRHVPMSRYLAPTVPIMTAVTGFDDRNMVNQCLLYRYLISYEPFNFKGRLTDFPDTVTYGQKMDTLRTELREWLWDATFRDTLGAEVIDVTDPARPVAHHPFSIYRQADGRQATVVANYDPDHEVRVRVVVAVNPPAALRYRFVDTAEWHTTTTDLTIPPRSAAVVLPDEALP